MRGTEHIHERSFQCNAAAERFGEFALARKISDQASRLCASVISICVEV